MGVLVCLCVAPTFLLVCSRRRSSTGIMPGVCGGSSGSGPFSGHWLGFVFVQLPFLVPLGPHDLSPFGYSLGGDLGGPLISAAEPNETSKSFPRSWFLSHFSTCFLSLLSLLSMTQFFASIFPFLLKFVRVDFAACD